MDELVTIVVGSAAVNKTLAFRALSATVDNPTNQWVQLDSIGATIPQYTLGATYPLPGTSKAQVSFTAPRGQVQPPTIAGQAATITFFDLALPASAGVGMLGGRAPYYDRNPLDINNSFMSQSIGPHAPTGRIAYTVPAGRRAYLESCFNAIILESPGDLALGFFDAYVTLTAASVRQVVAARIQGLAPTRSTSRESSSSTMELQASDQLQFVSANTYTATLATLMMGVKLTEFDA